MKVISIGELMVEMVNIEGDIYKKTFAGDTFNVAYYMKAYAPSDWDISYGTAFGVGDDDAVAFVQSHNVNTDKIIRHSERNIGLFILSNDACGEKQYRYWRGLSAAKTYLNTVQDFCDYDVVYFSGITAAITESRDNLIASIEYSKYKNSDMTVVYDFNYRRQLWTPEQAREFAGKVISLCDIIKISDEELPWIFGDDMTIEKLCQLSPNSQIIFTKGAYGAEHWEKSFLTTTCPAVKVETVVDTSAAGDSFISAYLWQRSIGSDVMTSLSTASKLASVVLGVKGSLLPKDKLPNLS